MLNDLRHALRSLLRRPAFSTVVILTLGLGLGANAAILAVVDAVLLRQLPYPDSDRLVLLHETVEREGRSERRTFTYPDFLEVRQAAEAFEYLSAAGQSSLILETESGLERLFGAFVSPAYFDVFGVRPGLGRALQPEPPTGAGGEPKAAQPPAAIATPAAEVVLSHQLWRKLSGDDPAMLGSVLRLDGEDYTVVGVMPESFDSGNVQLWVSILNLGDEALANRTSRAYEVVGRLRPAASMAQAEQQIDAVFAHLEEAWPESNTGYGGSVLSLHRELTGDLREPVMLLFGAVGLLLVIACANVANMLLINSLRRRRPAAICLALGAKPWHLFRRTLLETLLLGFGGAGLGVLFAAWGLPLLNRASPVRLPAYASLEVNLSVVAATLGAVVVIGTLLAALTARLDFGPTLRSVRSGCRTVAGDNGDQWLRRGLLGLEVALAFVVAVGALLLVRSWVELNRIDPGFEARELVFFRATLPAADADRHPALRRQLIDTVAAVPGVEAVALASDVPLEGGYSANLVSAEGAQPDPSSPYGGGHRTYRHFVSPGFFDTLELPLLQGRDFAATDHLEAPTVAIVSRRLAQRLWPGEDPIGRRFSIGTPSAEAPDEADLLTVVGMVEDLRYRTLRPDPERIAEDPDLFLPLEQFKLSSVTVAARTALDAGSGLIDIRQAAEPLAATMPLFGWATFGDFIDFQLRANRFSTLMMALFAALALILATIGIYGVFTHRVDERRREIGIRMALGADRGRVVRLVAADGLKVIAGGLAVGWLVAWTARGQLGELLYGLEANDLGLFTAITLVLATVGLGACLLPARRASRVDPQTILHDE